MWANGYRSVIRWGVSEMRRARLEPLEPLDLDVPDLPERSRLFALSPIGIGTEQAESLSSYLVRLARAHAVNPRHMLRAEFQHYAEEPLGRLARHADEVASMNGYGQHAGVFARVTAQLTTVPTIRYLTLLPLSELLPRNGAAVISRQPRWCPHCLAEMVRSGQEPFRPLVWALALYTVCHRHRHPLVAECQNCQKAQPFLPTYPDLMHCAYCRASLSTSHERECMPDVSKSDLWVAQSLADLVAKLPELDRVANRERFMVFLDHAIKEHSYGNRAGFCRAIGLPSAAFKDWYSCGQRPSLPQLMAVARGTQVLPADIFLRDKESSTQLQKVTTGLTCRAKAGLSASRRADLAASLATIVADVTDVRSVAQLARDIETTISCLRYWFAPECEVICRRRAEANRQAVAQRRKSEYQVVAEVVREVAGRNEFPGRRKVNEALRSLHLSLSQRDMVAAYRAAVMEVSAVPQR